MQYLFLSVFFLFSTDAFSLSKEERKALFAKATQDLKDKKIEAGAPQLGQTFPDLILDGKKVSVWAKDRPLVVTFYRGGWCPYCVAQLKEMNSSLHGPEKANLIAISPEKESEVQKTKKKLGLNFPMISDKDNKIAKNLSLVFRVDEKVVKEYLELGIDLNKSQGNQKNELPMPATYVIDKNLKIVFAFVDADYTKRADLNDVIAAVFALKK